MKRRIYTDTSVIGGCFDLEFSASSVQLFDRFRRGLDTLVLSDLTLAELEGAPSRVRQVLEGVPDDFLEEVMFSAEASALAQEYLAAGVIGAAHLEDGPAHCNGDDLPCRYLGELELQAHCESRPDSWL